jgi:hypothetical protein
MYFLSEDTFLAKDHFLPVGNPPPPRPRRPLFVIFSINLSCEYSLKTFSIAL